MAEVRVSDNVCHASALTATESNFTPAQYLKTNRAMLMMQDSQPARYPSDFDWFFIVCPFVVFIGI
jgi:hypothetical protein